MITGREVASSLYGALRLAAMDRGGMVFFNRTVEGFWRSFFAAVIFAPGYATLFLLHLAADPMAVHPVRIFLVEAIVYVIGWVAFPLAMAYLAPLFERDEQYIGFIVAYNWAAVWQMAAFLAMTTVASGLLGGGAVADVLAVATLFAVLFYQWFIARTALEITPGRAAAVVGLDVALTAGVHAVGDLMLRGGGA
jgi:hypothetical protein